MFQAMICLVNLLANLTMVYHSQGDPLADTLDYVPPTGWNESLSFFYNDDIDDEPLSPPLGFSSLKGCTLKQKPRWQ